MSHPSADSSGLTTAEARARLIEVGPNEPAARERRSIFSELLHSFANPLIGILIVASGVSADRGDWVNATIVAGRRMAGAAAAGDRSARCNIGPISLTYFLFVEIVKRRLMSRE